MRSLTASLFLSSWPVPWRRERYADGSASVFVGIYRLGLRLSIGSP